MKLDTNKKDSMGYKTTGLYFSKKVNIVKGRGIMSD